MADLEQLIFGYRVVTVDDDSRIKVSNLLLKAGIRARVDHTGAFRIRESDVGSFLSAARGRIRFEMSDRLGFRGFLYRNRRRYGVFAAILLTVVMNVCLSRLVWDIRIDGNESLSDADVVSALEEHGFGIGTSWDKIDKNRVKTALLSDTEQIAWISINRRGTVAYVEIIESENVGIQRPPELPYSNIIADRDGVVTDITVESGTPIVKVGDTVRRGDILISGVVDNERGSIISRADGVVTAESGVTLSVTAERKYEYKAYEKEKISLVSLKIFGKSINIFKNYGKIEKEYDIIERKTQLTLFGKYRLPITVTRTYVREYTLKEGEYTDSELVSEAKRMMGELITSELKGCDILRLRTGGSFGTDSYALTTEVVYSANIGKEREIDVTDTDK